MDRPIFKAPPLRVTAMLDAAILAEDLRRIGLIERSR